MHFLTGIRPVNNLHYRMCPIRVQNLLGACSVPPRRKSKNKRFKSVQPVADYAEKHLYNSQQSAGRHIKSALSRLALKCSVQKHENAKLAARSTSIMRNVNRQLEPYSCSSTCLRKVGMNAIHCIRHAHYPLTVNYLSSLHKKVHKLSLCQTGHAGRAPSL